MTTLEHVAMDATTFPDELLEGIASGLVLFAAAFNGTNDAIHFAEAGVPDVTLVDRDGEALEKMRALYRDDRWRWIEFDAWEFAEMARYVGHEWDVVTVDTWLGDAERRSLDDLEAWTSIARRAVVVTAGAGSTYHVPAGWGSRLLRRTSAAYWLILERPAE